MLDDEGFRARVDVVDGIRFLLYLRRPGYQNAVVGVQFAHRVVARVEVSRDAGAEVDSVIDEALVRILDGLDQSLTRVCARVENRDGAAVEGLARVVRQFSGAERIRPAGVGINNQLPRGNPLLKENGSSCAHAGTNGQKSQ